MALKLNLYTFTTTQTTVDGSYRHSTVVPADTYREAMQGLARNAAKTTGVPAVEWLLADIRRQS